MLGTMNLGAQKLRLLIEPRGKQQALSVLLAVDPAVITRWAWKGADGRGTKPNAENRIRLLELLGIEMSDWDKPVVETPDVSRLKFQFDAPEPGAAPAAPFPATGTDDAQRGAS